MTLPNLTPPGGLLAELLDTWQSRGWDPADLDGFRMELDDDSGEGDEDDDGEDGDDDTSGDDDGDEGEDDLDARIATARREAADRRRALKPWKQLAKEFGVTPEEARDIIAKAKKAGSGDDDGDAPDAEEIRRAAERDATEKVNRRIVRSEVKVLASELFADPDDAPLYLDLDEYDVDDDGELADRDDVIADLKKVLAEKPHLAKTPKNPKPDKGQGARDGSAKPSVAAGREMYERKTKKSSSAA